MADKTLTQLGQIADGDIGDSILAYVAFGGLSYKMTASQLRTEYFDAYYQELISGGTENAIATYDGSGSLQEGGLTLLSTTLGWNTGNATFKHNITDNASIVDIKGNGNSYAGELRIYNDDDTDYGSISSSLITSQMIESINAPTQDAVALLGRAGGTGSYVGTVTTTTLTDSRTYTLPDTNGIIAIEPSNGWVEGASNLTTQYRGVFVSAADTVTESSSIVTDASGNLGVGVTPLFRLHPRDTSGVIAYFDAGGTVTGAAGTGPILRFAGHDGISARDFAEILVANENSTPGNYGGYIAFATRPNAGSTTERMRINSSGNILIGATLPVGSEKLHVAGGIYATGTIKGKRLSTPKSGTYTATTNDRRVSCTNTWTLGLYACSGNSGEFLIIKNAGTGVITVDPNGSETIDGATTLTLFAGNSLTIFCNGTSWEID